MKAPADYNLVASRLDAALLPPREEVLLLNGADLNPQPMRWLWPDWLAYGKLHLLAGAPGQGKTTLALSLAATVTSGGRWPDGSRCEPGNVLIWSGEDDHADTLLPRLLAAGAHRNRCFFIGGTRVNGETRTFDPGRDMVMLEEAVARSGGASLLVIDPIVSVVTGNSHQNTEVRRDLQPVVDLGARLDAAVLGITHLSKGGQGGDPVSRVLGSVAFSAVARIVLLAGKVRTMDGDERRVIARGKSNIGADQGGFEYSIDQTEALPGIEASYITWGKVVEGTAREIFAEAQGEEAVMDPQPARSEARHFLVHVLKSGPCPKKYVEAEAKAAGISWRTIRRAASEMGVIKRPAPDGMWYWEYPDLANQLALGVQSQNVGHFGQPQHAAAADLLNKPVYEIQEAVKAGSRMDGGVQGGQALKAGQVPWTVGQLLEPDDESEVF